MRTLIRGTIVPLLNWLPPEFYGYVIVDGNRIAEVCHGEPPSESFDKVIDGPNQVVVPGLVNTHTHAAMTILRGVADDLPLQIWLEKEIFPREAKLKPEHIYWGTKLAIAEMLLGGTTCFADMYFMMDETAKAVAECGIRASLATGIVEFLGQNAIENSVAFAKKWDGQAGGRIKTMLGPHAIYTCPPKFMSKIIQAAKENNFGLHVHMSETKKEVEDSHREYGMSPVKKFYELGMFDQPVLAAHCVHLDAEDIKIMAKNRVSVALCPSSNFKLSSGIPNVPDLDKAGVNISVATDGAASNNDLDMFEEMRWASFIAKVLDGPWSVPANRALEMATRCGARALQFNGLGTLEPGSLADLVVLEFDKPHLVPMFSASSHIAYSAKSSDVKHVMIDGHFVVWDRMVTTFDAEETKKKVENIAMEIC